MCAAQSYIRSSNVLTFSSSYYARRKQHATTGTKLQFKNQTDALQIHFI
jgi:hypothetical protein